MGRCVRTSSCLRGCKSAPEIRQVHFPGRLSPATVCTSNLKQQSFTKGLFRRRSCAVVICGMWFVRGELYGRFKCPNMFISLVRTVGQKCCACRTAKEEYINLHLTTKQHHTLARHLSLCVLVAWFFDIFLHGSMQIACTVLATRGGTSPMYLSPETLLVQRSVLT